MATGDTYSVRGNRTQVTSQLREHEGGLAVLVNVYGDAITIGVAHVAFVEQMPGDWISQA